MLTGSLVAIATPMRKGGALDLPALGKLIDFHVANGTSGIVIVGTTGESPTVDVEEHCLLIKTAVVEARGRIPVVAGTGANSTAEAVDAHRLCEGSRRAQRAFRRSVLQQAHAGRAVPPLSHDRRKGRPAAPALQRAGTHRCRSGQRYDAASRRGARHRRHQGRDGGPRRAAASSSRRSDAASRREFAVYSGDDITGAAAHADGRPWRDFRHRQRGAEAHGGDVPGGAERRHRHGARRNDRLLGLHRSLFVEANPIPVKWALAKMGLIENELRLPMVPLSAAVLRGGSHRAGRSGLHMTKSKVPPHVSCEQRSAAARARCRRRRRCRRRLRVDQHR